MTKEEQWKREAEIKLDELDDRGFDFDNWSISDAYERGYCDCAEPREKRIVELETQIEQLQKINNEQKETLKKVRVALIQERTANIVNYGKGGVEMFDSMFEVLKGVSN